MIMALLIGREGSIGFPKKNIYPILKRPTMLYPLLASLNSKFVDEVYVSTDSKKIEEIAKKFGVEVIKRPPELATSESLSDDVFVHGYRHVKNKIKKEIELVVILMCNAIMILPETIDKGIEILRTRQDADSAVTVSSYNMWNPIRARRIDKDGFLHPFVPFDKFNFKVDSNRQKQETVYFHDCGVSVVRPKCLENVEEGLLPQKWMGQKIYPLIQSGGLDIDYSYEVPLAENWLREKGFTEKRLPYKKRNR